MNIKYYEYIPSTVAHKFYLTLPYFYYEVYQNNTVL